MKRHEVERRQRAEAQLATRGEPRGVAEEGFEAAAHVDETLGRVVDEPGGELGIEAFARRIGDDHVAPPTAALSAAPAVPGITEMRRAIRRAQLREAHFEALQRVRADFVQAQLG